MNFSSYFQGAPLCKRRVGLSLIVLGRFRKATASCGLSALSLAQQSILSSVAVAILLIAVGAFTLSENSPS